MVEEPTGGKLEERGVRGERRASRSPAGGAEVGFLVGFLDSLVFPKGKTHILGV